MRLVCLALVLASAPVALGSASSQSATHEPVPDPVWAEMQGKSWHSNRGCPGRENLSLVTVPFLDFEGAVRSGRLVVHKDVAAQVASAFDEIFASRTFRFRRIELVDEYGGDDDASMEANNTSAFNCRFVGRTTTLSAHALGIAIDINPVENPYVVGRNTYPPAGGAFDEPAERRDAFRRGQAGLITAGDAVETAFRTRGWVWGGTWETKKDYQHFSTNGR